AGACAVSCEIVFEHMIACWQSLAQETAATTTTSSTSTSSMPTSTPTTTTLPSAVQSSCRLPRRPTAGIACGIATPSTAYYVSAGSGDDHNDGASPTHAWATLDEALLIAPSGSAVLVSAGTYISPELVLARPLVVKGGYDATFTTW